MLPTAELDAMRSAVAGLMPDTCYILSETLTSDGQGGFSSSWGTVGTATCRLDAKAGQETVAGDALQPFYTYTLTVPYSTGLTASNRVTHGGVTYAVTSVDADKSWPITQRAQVERVE